MYHTQLMPPVDIDATVIANARLSRDYSVLSLAAPEVGKRTQPGQFVMVKPAGITDPLLRRPFSVFEVLRNARGRGHRRQHPQQARRPQHQETLRARTGRRGVVPRSARRAVHAGRGARRSVDGRRRRRPRAVCDAGRITRGARRHRRRCSTARAPPKNCSISTSSSSSASRWCSPPRMAGTPHASRAASPVRSKRR